MFLADYISMPGWDPINNLDNDNSGFNSPQTMASNQINSPLQFGQKRIRGQQSRVIRQANMAVFGTQGFSRASEDSRNRPENNFEERVSSPPM